MSEQTKEEFNDRHDVKKLVEVNELVVGVVFLQLLQPNAQIHVAAVLYMRSSMQLEYSCYMYMYYCWPTVNLELQTYLENGGDVYHWHVDAKLQQTAKRIIAVCEPLFIIVQTVKHLPINIVSMLDLRMYDV